MGKEKSYSIEVEGMTCGNCALTISKFLTKKGMKDISANAANGAVHFTADEAVSIEKIFKGINELGYHVKQADTEMHDHSSLHQHTGSKKLATLLLIAAFFTLPLLLHMFVGRHSILNNPWLQLFLCIPVYAIAVYHFGLSAFRSLKNGIPNMDVLIILGTSAAFIYSAIGLFLYPESAHDYLFFETAATITTFVLLGNWIETKTVNATTSAIKSLAQLQPSKAKIMMTDSIGKESIMEVDSKFIRLNDIVLVSDGESVPTDGKVTLGNAEVDESMITGESLPVNKSAGDLVTGGSILLSGNLRVKATAIGSATALSEIIRLVQKAQATKPPMQKLADKISGIFVPVVLAIAILAFLINYFLVAIPFDESMMRSIAVLVVACPCAMGLATPAAVAVGLGRAAKHGILIKGGDTLERFKDIRQIVFDKTGTLTTGNLKIQSYETNGMEAEQFKSVITSLENYSTHPIAKSVLRQWKQTAVMALHDIKETKGVGVSGLDAAGNLWQLGSFKLLRDQATKHTNFDLHLLKNGNWAGGIKMQDELRADARETINALHKAEFKTILLSGDRKEKAEHIATATGINTVLSEQSPTQKMEHLEALIRESPTMMVGDGINDAPALAKADIGVSLSDSTKVALQSANVILSNNHLRTLPKAIRLGKMTYQTIKQNLFWAFFYNVLFIPFAAMGYLSPIWAALIMALSDVVLVLNSLRLNFRKVE